LVVREHLFRIQERKARGSPDRSLKSKSLEIISPPFGFRHITHVGRTGSEGFGFGSGEVFGLESNQVPDVEPDWMAIVELAGVSHSQLNHGEWLKFIIDFTLQHSDPSEMVIGKLFLFLFFFLLSSF